MHNITSKYKLLLDKVVRSHGIVGEYEVNVFSVTVGEMRKFHHKYMASQGYEDEYHDVLSFPLESEIYPDGITRLGDILVCNQEKNFEPLIEHACLHLLGIHHE